MQAHGTHEANSSQQCSSAPVQHRPRAAVPIMRAAFCRGGCSNTKFFQHFCQRGQSQDSVRQLKHLNSFVPKVSKRELLC